MARLIAGFSRQAVADLLYVSERTVRNWEAARASVPYSAYKLVCIMGGYELPGEHWRGFRICGDILWSPEGKAFSCYDLAYWGLTCAIAREHLERQGIAQDLPAKPVADLAPQRHERAAQAAGAGNPVPVRWPQANGTELGDAGLPVHGKAVRHQGLVLTATAAGGLNGRV